MAADEWGAQADFYTCFSLDVTMMKIWWRSPMIAELHHTVNIYKTWPVWPWKVGQELSSDVSKVDGDAGNSCEVVSHCVYFFKFDLRNLDK
jgi:hypothetical protein